MNMKSLLTFSKLALTNSTSVLIFGLSGFPSPNPANPESSSHEDRSWHEDYLIGKSDMDAVWYYERRRWRS